MSIFDSAFESSTGNASVLIMVKILCCEPSPLCIGTICEQRFVISTRRSPLTPSVPPFLSLSLCTLSRLWLDVTFQGEVIIMSLLQLQMETVFLFIFITALTQAVEGK